MPRSTDYVRTGPYRGVGLIPLLAALALAVPAAGQSFTVFCLGQSGPALLSCLRASHSPATVYSYNQARDTLFAFVDDGDRTRITDLYVMRVLPIRPGADPTTEGCNGDKDNNSSTCSGARTINTEHLWPQSLGADTGRPEADMHHLYPSRGDVNTVRGNNPFGQFPYRTATALYRDTLTYPPSPVPTDSLTYSAARSGMFMPRASVRGDIARALFYFRSIYEAEATATAARVAFFDGMRATLLAWHRADPPDAAEQARSGRVKLYQGNDNPFALDTTLAARAYGMGATGVHDAAGAASVRVRVYPSPARGAVQAEGFEGTAGVYDVLGRRVASWEAGRVLDVRGLAPGLYVLRTERQAARFIVAR
jgi:hypothetical protein